MHRIGQIGSYNADGSRTFSTPGDVCLTCSDQDKGQWVPVSLCPQAMAAAEIYYNWLGNVLDFDDEEPEIMMEFL